MKPAPFDYVRPETLAEACALLAGDEDARVIAGGQTLVPMLAMRLARPARLIDIARCRARGHPRRRRRHRRRRHHAPGEAERDPVIRASVPMLARVLPWVGHPPTRNRGTVGGSIANADPSAEIPLVGRHARRRDLLRRRMVRASMPADDFFIGPMLTTSIRASASARSAFRSGRTSASARAFFEISAREIGFCLCRSCGAGCARRRRALPRRRARRRRCRRPAVAAGCVLTQWRQARCGVDIRRGQGGIRRPRGMSDLHASAAYRRRVAGALCIRALEARAQCRGEPKERRAMKVNLRINGANRSADVEPRKTLLDCLRENFCSTAPTRDANMASAAPARCWSMASRCAPA